MDPKAVRSWILYDWANSAFATTIMAAIMPVFFSEVAASNLDKTTATAYWGYTQSIALLFVFLLSPILGAIADFSGRKKWFLRFFTWLGVAASLLLYTVGQGEWFWASVLVVIGTLAFSSANVFYDAFLPEIVPEEKRDYVSSQGYAYGYIGGGLLLAINLVMIQFHDWFAISKLAATQLSFLSVGIWWFLFSLPFFKNVPEKTSPSPPQSVSTQIKQGISSVCHTLKRARQYPELFKFLLAFWFFSDGINTIIKMATIYGTEIGIGSTHLILALLITQFVGIPCTLFFGKIADRLGSKTTLILTLIVYLCIVILGYFMQTALHFYLLAILVGTVQGASQALSRSIFSRLIPKNQEAEFFGFFGLSGKFASIFGPFVFGLIGQLSGSSRTGILSLVFFFLAGIILLYWVDLEKGKTEAMEQKSA